MIKAETSEDQNEQDLSYPVLARSRDTGNVFLMTTQHSGTVVTSVLPKDWNIGYYTDIVADFPKNWDILSPNTVITLRNQL